MVANPFVSADFLMVKLAKIDDKKGIDLSVFKAILRALRFLPAIDAVRLLEKHSNLLYYVAREFCLVLSAASKQETFARETVKTRVKACLSV